MPETLPGIIVAEYNCSRSGRGDDSAACDFAKTLARETGGPEIRAVVLLDTSDTDTPKVLARYPRMVVRLGGMAALACAAPEAWNSYLVTGRTGSNRASLYRRVTGGLQVQNLYLKDPSDLANAVRLLGIEHGVIAEEPAAGDLQTDSCPDVVRVKSAEVRMAAAKFARAALQQQGLWHEGSESSLRVRRSVGYSILRPQRTVFHPEELCLSKTLAGRPAFFVSDLSVGTLYSSAWRPYAERNLAFVGEIQLDLSESSKTWHQVYDICGRALECGLPRNGVMIGVGGGVTLDVTGFAASIFRRGVGFIRVPTSLVGLVDVSVGIKQSVNSHGKKNLLGSFYPPLASINDYRFLATLPASEISCGMAEILKMALLRDEYLLELLEQVGPELILSRFTSPAHEAKEVLLRAELLMMEELAPNLYEDSLTRLVDFGHTFSPAIEAASNCRISHGRAVAIDMLISTALAVVLGRAADSFLKRIVTLLPRLGLPVWDESVPSLRVLFESLDDVERHRGGSLNLIVVTKPESSEVLETPSFVELKAALLLLQEYISSTVSEIEEPNHLAYARTAI